MKKQKEEKTPPTEFDLLSRTNKHVIRGATLFHGHSPCRFSGYRTIPPATDVCLHVAEYSARRAAHLTAPSAVHLTNCFLPDSQHRGLSGKACFAVISASTVCTIFFSIILPRPPSVKPPKKIFLRCREATMYGIMVKTLFLRPTPPKNVLNR